MNCLSNNLLDLRQAKIKYRPSIIVRLTQKLWNIIDGDHDREIVGYIEEIEKHKKNPTSQEHICIGDAI